MLNSKLHGLSLINQEVKKILVLADDIELTAVNGLLIAAKAGISSSGFSVIAQDIQNLSINFSQLAIRLSRLIHRIAFLVAQGMNIAGRIRIIKTTLSLTDDAKQFISNAEEKCGQDWHDNAKAIDQSLNTALALLNQLEKQCIIGIALGRCGKIEAINGLGMAKKLHQVSTEVNDQMNAVFEIATIIYTNLQTWRNRDAEISKIYS